MSNKRQMKKMTAKEKARRNAKKAARRARRAGDVEALKVHLGEVETARRAKAINIEIAQPGDLVGL